MHIGVLFLDDYTFHCLRKGNIQINGPISHIFYFSKEKDKFSRFKNWRRIIDRTLFSIFFDNNYTSNFKPFNNQFQVVYSYISTNSCFNSFFFGQRAILLPISSAIFLIISFSTSFSNDAVSVPNHTLVPILTPIPNKMTSMR